MYNKVTHTTKHCHFDGFYLFFWPCNKINVYVHISRQHYDIVQSLRALVQLVQQVSRATTGRASFR